MTPIEELQSIVAYANMEAQTACVHHHRYAHLEEIASRLQSIIERMEKAEPVAWMRYGSDGNPVDVLIGDEPTKFLHGRNTPLYAAPPVPESPVIAAAEKQDD